MTVDETGVEELRKRAREEVVPIPSIYNDALIELSTLHDLGLVYGRETWTYPTNSALAQACYKRLDNNSVVFNFAPSTYL